MIRFAALVYEKGLQNRSVDGINLYTYASSYLSGFLSMVAFSSGQLRDDGANAYYVFESNVPDDLDDSNNTASLRNQPLPVNMDSAVFGSYLHLGRYYAAKGDAVNAQKYKSLSARHLNWLRSGSKNQNSSGVALFETRIQSNGTSYLVWRYSTYSTRMERIGHSNLTYRYMYDAYLLGQVTITEKVRLENTFLRIDSPILQGLNGATARVYLDGSQASADSSHTSFYLPLAVRYRATMATSAIPIAKHFDGKTGLFYFGALALSYSRGL